MSVVPTSRRTDKTGEYSVDRDMLAENSVDSYQSTSPINKRSASPYADQKKKFVDPV